MFGIQALIEDYDLLDQCEDDNLLHNQGNRNNFNHIEIPQALKIIQRTLLRLVHIIFQDTKQLKSQLFARLNDYEIPEIQKFLSQITTDENVGLYSLTGSLSLPDEDTVIPTLTGHIRWINDPALTPDGKTLISCSGDYTIKIWDLETRTEKFTLIGHKYWVNSLAITSDGKTLISASSDNTIKIWDLETRTEKFTLIGHKYWVNSLAITSDGKTLISASSDNTIKIWDLETRTEKFTLRGHIYCVNTIILTLDGKTLISGSDDMTIKIWNLVTGRQKFTLTGHRNSVTVLAVIPEGKTLISGSSDNTIKIWDLETRTEKFTLTGHLHYVNDIAVTPDGKTLMSASDDKTIKIWDLTAKREKFILTDHSDSVRAITFTPDGKTLISGSEDKTIKIWNLFTGRQKFTLTGHSNSVNALAVTPDGKTLISSSSDKTIKISDLVTGRQKFTLTGHSNSVNALAVTPDGKTLISSSSDKTIKTWDLVTGRKKFTLTGHDNLVRAITVTPYGNTLIDSFDRTVEVWDLVTGRKKFTLTGHISFIRVLVVTPDGQTLISGSDDMTIKIWSLVTGKEKFTLIRHTNKRDFILTSHTNSVNAIAVTPDGKTIISGSSDKTIKIWDLLTREEKFTLTGHTNSVNAIIVTPDGKTIISGSSDKTIKIWSLVTGKEKFTLLGHTNSVKVIVLTSDGTTLISGSEDKNIKVWNVLTGEEIATFTGESPITCCAVAPDRVTIVAGEYSGRLHFLCLQGKQQTNTKSFSTSTKDDNFVSRDFVFSAINNFLHRYPKGYFTIVGVPGSGKTAILLELVRDDTNIIYYNTEIPGKNRVDVFLTDICTELESRTLTQTSLQTRRESEVKNANEGSWLFSNLLQQVSEILSPENKLIIIIDGLDRVDINHQAVGTNLFYLPRYLPEQVYFIFARRPYQKSLAGLLIEAPSQILDLSDFQKENRDDVRELIQSKVTAETQSSQRNIIDLIDEDEDNFMYVQQVLTALDDGFYDKNDVNQIPPGLHDYYQQIWEQMQGDGLSDIAMNVLQVLSAASQPLSRLEISEAVNIDVFDVMEILTGWFEFLLEFREGKQVKYQLFHHGFRLWLSSSLG